MLGVECLYGQQCTSWHYLDDCSFTWHTLDVKKQSEPCKETKQDLVLHVDADLMSALSFLVPCKLSVQEQLCSSYPVHTCKHSKSKLHSHAHAAGPSTAWLDILHGSMQS